MGHGIPKVRDGYLQQQTAGGIILGSAEWYAWLEQHSSFCFETPRMTFTARKEQRPGGWYWYAYRRTKGKLHTAYLGKTSALTLERLNAVTAVLERAVDSLELRVSGDAPWHHEASVIPPRTPIAPGIAPESTRKHLLPVQLTSLVGREQDVAAAGILLRRPEVRLLSIIGTAGVGKTRLAVQVAADLLDDFADGVYFVPLAPIRDPNLVLSAIAQTFGLRESGNESLSNSLKAYLHHKHLLLLLDNFEQVVAAAPLLVELLTACLKLKLLVTSREVLHLGAEQQFLVSPLTLPDLEHVPSVESLLEYSAVKLFTQRAQAVKPDFQISQTNAYAIAEICSRLDGLPLAIELAAARIKLLSPQALLARLDHRLQVLAGGTCDLPERQQTLRNTIQWSYNLLNAEEQRLFKLISVFVGGCTLEAVEAVSFALGDGGPQVLNRVASLIDKNLLQLPEQAGDEPRLMMLETIREYGLEALATSGEMEATRHAHAAYYLELVEEAEPELTGPQQGRWYACLEREHENLRAAFLWLVEQEKVENGMESTLRLGGALQLFWLNRGHPSQGRVLLEQALARSEGVAASVRAKALVAAGRLARSQGDYDRAEALCEEGLTLYREIGEIQGIAFSLMVLGMIALRRGNLAVADSLTEKALALYREVGDKNGIAYSFFYLALSASDQGEYAKAQAVFEESLRLFRERGNETGIAATLFQSAQVLFVSQDDAAKVHSLLAEGLALFKKLGDKNGMAGTFSLLGQMAFKQGQVATARSMLEKSVELHRELGQRQDTVVSLSVLGRLATRQGDHATGRAFCEESLVLSQKVGEKKYIATCLEGLAEAVAAQTELAWAARLLGAAQALREDIGVPIPPVGQADYERLVAAVRILLGEKSFAGAWTEGRTMTPEQALVTQKPAPISVELPSPTKEVSPATYPNRLSGREIEVLRLVSMGLTDAQVAEKLIISPRTVHTHLSSIYSKLGITSRSAATRYAIEHQLA